MKTKKIKQVIEKGVQDAMLEHVQYCYPKMSKSIEGNQSDFEGERGTLELRKKEAETHELEERKWKLYKEECKNKELGYYKKELEREAKARKKAVEQQRDLKYLVKNLQNQLKENEKNYQRLEREQKKNYKKIKAYVKKNNKKHKRKFNYIKNILAFILYMVGLPYYGESLKKIEKCCKEKSKRTRKNRELYVDSNYTEIADYKNM